jgi:ABC-type glycerol-3-phosphate transport system permease component
MLPLGWMITVALKPDNAPVFTSPPEWVPTEHWQWNNFWRVLTIPSRPFARYTLNTLIIVGGNIIGTLFSCSLVAYAFAKLRFRGREFLFNVLIVTMLIPWQVLMIPQFLMFFKMVRDVPALDRALVLRERVLHLPRPSVHADAPPSARGRGTGGRLYPFPGLLAHRPSALQARPRCVRRVRLHRGMG